MWSLSKTKKGLKLNGGTAEPEEEVIIEAEEAEAEGDDSHLQ